MSRSIIRWLGVSAALGCLPIFLGDYWLNVAVFALLAVIGASSLNLVTGLAGLLSVANSGLMALAGLVCGVVGAEMGASPLIVLVLGVAAATIAGIAFGLTAMRVQGLYLIVATLSLHFVAVYALNRVQSEVAGPAGFLLSAPSAFGFTLRRVADWYWALLPIFMLSLVAAHWVVKGRWGRRWRLMAVSDDAAMCFGIDVRREKLLAFASSSALAGLHGVLFAYYLGSVAVETYSFALTISLVAMLFIGGVGTFIGPIIGGVLVSYVPYGLRSLSQRLQTGGPVGDWIADNVYEIEVGVYGALLIGILLVQPKGLAEVAAKTERRIASFRERTSQARPLEDSK